MVKKMNGQKWKYLVESFYFQLSRFFFSFFLVLKKKMNETVVGRKEKEEEEEEKVNNLISRNEIDKLNSFSTTLIRVLSQL